VQPLDNRQPLWADSNLDLLGLLDGSLQEAIDEVIAFWVSPFEKVVSPRYRGSKSSASWQRTASRWPDHLRQLPDMTGAIVCCAIRDGHIARAL
jgi:hypothetical protein